MPQVGAEVITVAAPSGATVALLEYAQKVAIELSRPYMGDKHEYMHATKKGDDERLWLTAQNLRALPKEAASVRRGKLQVDDWWIILNVQFLQFIAVWCWANEPVYRPLVYTLSAVLVLYSLSAYADLRKLRTLLIRQLLQIDLVRRMYNSEDIVGKIYHAIWRPLRPYYGLRHSDRFEDQVASIADNLDVCLRSNGSSIRWVMLLGFVCKLLFIPLAILLLLASHRADIEVAVMMVIAGFWFVVLMQLPLQACADYRRVVSREHWLLDIYDRYQVTGEPPKPLQ